MNDDSTRRDLKRVNLMLPSQSLEWLDAHAPPHLSRSAILRAVLHALRASNFDLGQTTDERVLGALLTLKLRQTAPPPGGGSV
jgi:hypothetical protein